VSLRAC